MEGREDSLIRVMSTLETKRIRDVKESIYKPTR